MFFTQDDYKKILEWLKHHSIKDSELPLVLIIGNEEVPVLLNGENARIPLKDIQDSIKIMEHNLVNLTDLYNRDFTLLEAIESVEYKKPGLFITFFDRDLQTWKLYQFTGIDVTLWNTLSMWKSRLDTDKEHFKGLIISKSTLLEMYPLPDVGDYAYVGTYLSSAILYRCNSKGVWTESTEKPLLVKLTLDFGYDDTLTVSQSAITKRFEYIEQLLFQKIESTEQ